MTKAVETSVSSRPYTLTNVDWERVARAGNVAMGAPADEWLGLRVTAAKRVIAGSNIYVEPFIIAVRVAHAAIIAEHAAVTPERAKERPMLGEWTPRRGSPGAGRWVVGDADDRAAVTVWINDRDEWTWRIRTAADEVANHDFKVQLLTEQDAKAAADAACLQWYRLPPPREAAPVAVDASATKDDGTTNWAFSQWTAHAPCASCFPSPPSPASCVSKFCPVGRLLWDEYVRRFNAKSHARRVEEGRTHAVPIDDLLDTPAVERGEASDTLLESIDDALRMAGEMDDARNCVIPLINARAAIDRLTAALAGKDAEIKDWKKAVKINVLNIKDRVAERDAARAQVATLTRERDEKSAYVDKLQSKLAAAERGRDEAEAHHGCLCGHSRGHHGPYGGTCGGTNYGDERAGSIAPCGCDRFETMTDRLRAERDAARAELAGAREAGRRESYGLVSMEIGAILSRFDQSLARHDDVIRYLRTDYAAWTAESTASAPTATDAPKETPQ